MRTSALSLRSPHQSAVLEFMQRAGQKIPEEPTIPPKEVRLLRARLILEEAVETVEALGFNVDRDILNPDNLMNTPDENMIRLKDIIDGCCDTNVVVNGTLVACGIPDVFVQAEVDYNNLQKFGPGHTRDEFGKLIKPPGHKPPDLDGILLAMGYTGP